MVILGWNAMSCHAYSTCSVRNDKHMSSISCAHDKQFLLAVQ